MRIAIVKPDFRVRGGFEIVLDRIAAELGDRGHDVSFVTLDVYRLPRTPFGVVIPPGEWRAAEQFFFYATMLDAFTRMDLSEYDLVISSQPPSFAVNHPRHLALFFHHMRAYYDLSDVHIAGGHLGDVNAHLQAQARIRRLDNEYLRRPTYILAGSEVVADRLRHYNGLDDVGVFHAGAGVPDPHIPASAFRFGNPVCVSRHEFPKRTELFVHAMKLLPDLTGEMIGSGGRLEYVRRIDDRLSQPGVHAMSVDSLSLWLGKHEDLPPTPHLDTNVRFHGRVSDRDLGELYAQALCVVAPAFDEDYGLTAIEAMHYGKPIVVCKDGGGLTLFVEHGVNGLVVNPDGPSIAAAIRLLHEDHDLARELGENARATAARYSWERAMDEIESGIERVFERAAAKGAA